MALRSPGLVRRPDAARIALALSLLAVADLENGVDGTIDDRASHAILGPRRDRAIVGDGCVSPFVEDEDFGRVLRAGAEAVAECLFELNLHDVKSCRTALAVAEREGRRRTTQHWLPIGAAFIAWA